MSNREKQQNLQKSRIDHLTNVVQRCIPIEKNSSGIIRKAVPGNLVIRETRTGICVVSKYGAYAGVNIHDVKFHDMIMECKRPFLIQSAIKGPLDAEEQHLSDLEFTNISGNATRAVNSISIINSKAGFDLSTAPC